MKHELADPTLVRAALAQRLRAAAEVLLPEQPEREDDAAADAAVVLERLVEHARASDGSSALWLVLVALSATYPTDDAVRASRRSIELASTSDAMLWLLETSLGRLGASGDPIAQLEVVDGGVVVDVDFSARHDLNTGIQRVVRSTMPTWDAEHDVVLVARTGSGTMRRLDEVERERVLRWSGPLGEAASTLTGARVVVPWRSVVVLPEVPAPHLCASTAALAEHSGNAVSIVGYDCIPVVSADLMPPVEPNRFVRYLTIVKHATRVSGISVSAAAEFRGFAHMLPAQGLEGPDVTECMLPVEVPAAAFDQPVVPGDLPLVVCVGSHEPRKNHLAVLHAAERLWREGLGFRLRLIGGSSWASDEFDAVVARLRRRGRAVEVGRAIGDAELWAAYREARFTVFPSLHEGFGLPVAESLAVGTPAVTSSYGSTEEIAADGGTLLVDPRDDDDLLRAMRSLLVDDALRARLSAEATQRRPRTWEDYARELWTQLVDDVEVAR
ncbi:glycosyltransferase [Cellulomonas sp. NPDC055163]